MQKTFGNSKTVVTFRNNAIQNAHDDLGFARTKKF